MKKGVTPIIAVVLLLMMTVAAFGMTYVWVNTTTSGMQENVGQSIKDIQAKASSCMNVESSHFNSLYVRNCGKGVIAKSSLSVYVNGKPANFTLAGDIAEGEMREVILEFPSIEESNSIALTSGNAQASRTITEDDIREDIDSDNSLAGYWPFDEGAGTTARDLSGNVNDGTLVNGPQWVSGKSGAAVGFDGVDDYVRFANTPIVPQNSSVTISAWVYPKSANSRYIFAKAYGSSYAGRAGTLYWNSDSGFRLIAPLNTTSTFIVYSLTGKPINTWHFVVGVIDINATDVTGKIYVNGVLEGSGRRVFSGTPTGTGPAYLATEQNTGTPTYFNGAIDSVRIWNRALSADEIKALHALDA